ncbi:MAG: DMT family transporter [Caldilineaceae bacterium]
MARPWPSASRRLGAAILGGMDSNQLLMLRMVIATTLFGLTIAVTARSSLRLPRQGMQAAIVVGAINAAGMILFFLSLNYLEASLGAMIIALSPPIVLTLLALRGERLTRRHLVRLGLALAGVYLLISPSGEVNWTGAALALAATFFFALQMAVTQWTLVSYPVRAVVFYVTGTMTVFVFGWWLLQGAVWIPPSPLGWFQVLMLAIVSTYFARLGYYAAIPHRQRPVGAAGPARNDAVGHLGRDLPPRAAGPLAGGRRCADPRQRPARRAALRPRNLRLPRR